MRITVCMYRFILCMPTMSLRARTWVVGGVEREREKRKEKARTKETNLGLSSGW